MSFDTNLTFNQKRNVFVAGFGDTVDEVHLNLFWEIIR
jgi:hypothetical protein